MWKKILNWIKYNIISWTDPNYIHPNNIVASGDPCEI